MEARACRGHGFPPTGRIRIGNIKPVDMDPGGVAAPIQIKTMTIGDDGLYIAELIEEMIDEHRQFRVDMEERIRILRTDIGGDGTGGQPKYPIFK
ncbi:MAG: hypothetical protein ACUVRX_00765 [Actinomycetota bacterium]